MFWIVFLFNKLIECCFDWNDIQNCVHVCFDWVVPLGKLTSMYLEGPDMRSCSFGLFSFIQTLKQFICQEIKSLRKFKDTVKASGGLGDGTQALG